MEAERTAERSETLPRGVVRIAAPPTVAFDLLAPFAAWLRDKLPGVSLEVLSSVRNLDLSQRDADIALRLAAPTQRDIVTLATLDMEIAAFPSPAYAATLPPEYGIADVAWIAWALRLTTCRQTQSYHNISRDSVPRSRPTTSWSSCARPKRASAPFSCHA